VPCAGGAEGGLTTLPPILRGGGGLGKAPGTGGATLG